MSTLTVILFLGGWHPPSSEISLFLKFFLVPSFCGLIFALFLVDQIILQIHLIFDSIPLFSILYNLIIFYIELFYKLFYPNPLIVNALPIFSNLMLLPKLYFIKDVLINCFGSITVMDIISLIPSDFFIFKLIRMSILLLISWPLIFTSYSIIYFYEIFSLTPASIFIIKVNLVLFLFLTVRAALPRYRYDQLMRLGWKVFLPLSLGFVVLTAGILLTFDGLPPLK